MRAGGSTTGLAIGQLTECEHPLRLYFAAHFACSGRLSMQVKRSTTTIDRVARDLGEDETWLSDIANEMDTETA